MNRIVLCLAVLVCAAGAQAQWVQNGNNINNTNSGNVGIGVSTPASLLHLYPSLTSPTGINVKLYEYATFGTTYSSWMTILGSNARASETTVSKMQVNVGLPNTNVAGAAAVVLNQVNGGSIQFHTAPAPLTKDADFSAPRVTIDSSGNVGIGTTTPLNLLHVNGITRAEDRIEVRKGGSDTIAAGSGFYVGDSNGDWAGLQLSANKGLDFWIDTAGSGWFRAMSILNPSGNVGIGTTNPGMRLDVVGTASVYGGGARRMMRLWDDSPTALGVGAGMDFMGKYDAAGNSVQFANIKGVKANGIAGDIAGKFVVSVTHSSGPVFEIATVSSTGLAVTGNISATGAITGATVIGAVYQDVAEWVPATVKMSPGTVVVLNREHANEVMPSARAYDTAVAGVVSAQPGVILGQAGESKAQIATTGRVRVHVDATAAPVAIGDLLVTGTKPGTAMKSQPIDVGGFEAHRPGTLIGKALEPLPGGEGDILVLLSLQ